MLGWRDDRDLADVVGEKEAKAIAKALEINTCGELITYFPRAFSRRDEISLSNGVTLVFFHHQVFGVWKGATIMVTGKVWVFQKHLTVTHPQCLVFSNSSTGPDAKPKKTFSSGAMKKLERYEGLTTYLAAQPFIPN